MEKLKKGAAPYPQSTHIEEVQWGREILKMRQRSGDNWPIAWVNETTQITSYGDGGGFCGKDPELTIGFARIFGDPPNHTAEDFDSDADVAVGYGTKGIKSSDMLYVEDTLYMFVRNFVPGDDPAEYTNSRVAWSKDLGKTWTWADWYFSTTFGCPAFVQFGQNYADARDDFVYLASQDNNNAYEYCPDVVLARVPKDKISDRGAYEFFAGFDSVRSPIWSDNIELRKPIFSDPQGTQRISMTHIGPLDCYFLVASHYPIGCTLETHSAALGIFEAKEPWGPWSTVYYDPEWSGQCRTYHHLIPPKWISPDGKSMWLLYSGLDGGLYDFCLKKMIINAK